MFGTGIHSPQQVSEPSRNTPASTGIIQGSNAFANLESMVDAQMQPQQPGYYQNTGIPGNDPFVQYAQQRDMVQTPVQQYQQQLMQAPQMQMQIPQTPQQIPMFPESPQVPQHFVPGQPTVQMPMPESYQQPQIPQQPADMATIFQNMQAQNARLQQMVDVLAANQTGMADALNRQQASQTKTEIPEFLKSADLDTVINDKTQLEQVFQKVYTEAVKAASVAQNTAMQNTIAENVRMQMEATQALDTFFQRHPQLSNQRDFVGIAVRTVKARNPNIQSASEVMQRVEQLMGLGSSNIPQSPQHPGQPQIMQTPYGMPQPMQMPPQAPAFAQPLGGVSGVAQMQLQNMSPNDAAYKFFMNNVFGGMQ